MFQEAREEENPVKREGEKGLNFKVYAQNISPLLTGLHIRNHMFIEFRFAWPFVSLRAFGIFELMIKALSKICCQRARRNSSNLPMAEKLSN